MHVRPERDPQLEAHLQAIAYLARHLPHATELCIPLHGGPQWHARLVLPTADRVDEVTVAAIGHTKPAAVENARLAALGPLKEIFLHLAPEPTPDTARALRGSGASALEPADEVEVPKRWRAPSGPLQATLFE